MVTIREACAPADLAEVHALFEAYGAEFDHHVCFQSFQAELDSLPGAYAPPEGVLLLAECDGGTAGCVALHKLEDGICEMKRLYVRPAYRSRKVGRILAEAIIGQARGRGYDRIRLDTLPVMERARALYETLGFKKVAPYRANAAEEVIHMEMDLKIYTPA